VQLQQAGAHTFAAAAAAAAPASGGQVSVKDAVTGRLGAWMQHLQQQFNEVQQLLKQLE
jgi:hypothetical protein